MKKIMLFEEFSKHKGGEVFPPFVFHKSNPAVRDSINKEGITCQKGNSYSAHSPEDSEKPAIFGYFGEIESYDSTWDDDVWKIDTNNASNKWFIDREMGDKTSVVTYEDVSRDHIELVYKGSGKSTF